MKIMVTGAAGFVGRYVIGDLLRNDHCVVAVSRPGVALPEFGRFGGQVAAAYCDLTDQFQVSQLWERFDVDAIIHLAGVSHVVSAGRNVSHLIATNTFSIRYICDAINQQEKKVVPFVLASTGLVYGSGGALAYPMAANENTPIDPRTAYAKSKAAAEYILTSYEGTAVKPYVMRPFNHTGSGQSPEFVCSGFAKKIAEAKDGVINVGNLEALRDISDVRDIASAYRLAVEIQPPQSCFVIGSGKLCKIGDVLDQLIQISGKKIEPIANNSLLRSSDDTAIYADYSMAKKLLGWFPKYSLKETLKDLVSDGLNSGS